MFVTPLYTFHILADTFLLYVAADITLSLSTQSLVRSNVKFTLFIYWNIEVSLFMLSLLTFELQVLKIYSLHILSEIELPVTLG